MKLPVLLLLGGGLILLLALVGVKSLTAPPAPNYALMQVQADAARDAAMREANQAAALAPLVTFTAEMFQVLLVVIMAGSVVGAGMLAADWWKAGAVRRRVLVLAAQAQVEAARRPNVPHTYSPHWANQQRIEGGPAPDVPQLAAALNLPGFTTLGQVRAGGWTLAPDRVLHALGPGGQALTSPGNKAMHLLFAAPTGEGKTNLMLLFILQFIRLGYSVYLLDLKFRPYHDTTGIDWARIAAHTTPGRAYTDPVEILDFLEWAAMDELERRRKAFNAGVPMDEIGPPIYLFIEEALALAGVDKTRPVMVWIGKIMQLGRDLGIFIAMAVQGALIKQLGGSIADQANTRTRFCGIDADDTTRARLMEVRRLADLPEPGPDFVVTPGVLYLRSDATARRPMIVRVPLVEAADVAWYLPEVVDAVPVAAEAGRARVAPGPARVVDFAQYRATSPTSAPALPTSEPLPITSDAIIAAEVGATAAEVAQIRQLVQQETTSGDILNQVWGVTGGRDYPKKGRLLAAVMARLVTERGA